MKRAQLVFWSWLNWTSFRRASKTQPWIQRRFRLWQQTALPSILAQRHDDWVYLLICDPRAARFTEPLRKLLPDERVHLVHGDEEERIVRASLPEARQYVVARLDSDDRYHPKVAAAYLDNAHRASRARPFLQFNRGFAHDIPRHQLYDWVQTSSPFAARVMGPEYRTAPKIRTVSHNTIKGRSIVLGGSTFVVSIHGRNTSTNLRCLCVREPLTKVRAKRVAEAFGLPSAVVHHPPRKPKKRQKPWHGLTQADLPSEAQARVLSRGSAIIRQK